MKASNLVQLAFIALAAMAVYLFVGSAQSDQRRTSCTALCAFAPDYAGRNRTAPDFTLPDMSGKMVSLSSYRGKTVFLNFWTKTCGPCLQEMPALADLAKALKGRSDMAVLTVSTDEGPADVKDTLQVALGGETPFPVLFDPDSKIINGKYGTRLFPETWVIDPHGVIRARFDGQRDWSAALAVEIGEMVAKPSGCLVDFYQGKPRGAFAGLCDDDG
ncbi:MAG TPA: TlpA disulfide reductase family protein [Minicystis sp.]|nr:TlpA disulfide reductase family protein [Minicystis sp.]